MKYKKWRELSVDFKKIPFKTFNIINIVNYPPAGNDVIECTISLKNDIVNAFIKYERSKVSDFKTECVNLNKLANIFDFFPSVIEYDIYEGRQYIVLEKKEGSRLSEIFKRSIKYKSEYLFEYGKTLAKIHDIKNMNFGKALQRPINDIPTSFDKNDKFIVNIIKWLNDNKVEKNYDTFIHGDFHYANVLFKNKVTSGVVDFEYSGMGFKEQDIAWACVVRPTQAFMIDIEDIVLFLKGYSSIATFDIKKFVWCYVNGCCHFYIMNNSNEKYKSILKKNIKTMIMGDELHG